MASVAHGTCGSQSSARAEYSVRKQSFCCCAYATNLGFSEEEEEVMRRSASGKGTRSTWAEAKQSGSEEEEEEGGAGVRESAWPVGVRWRETEEEEREWRR